MSKETTNESIGFTGALFLIFLTLKLMKVIDWSWWWITSPLWIPAIVILITALIAIIVALCKKN